MFKKISKYLLISIFTILALSQPLKAQALVECYKIQGESCVSDGLQENCNESFLYESSLECQNHLPCPDDTDREYDDQQECLNDCYVASGQRGECTGPGNRCCYYPETDDPIGGEPVTSETLDMFNPIKRFSTHPEKLETPGDIISFILADFAFYLAGLILFAMLVWGGFEMIAGAANKKSLDAGKQRVTAALIGFLILFSVYWLARILESIFNIEILF